MKIEWLIEERYVPNVGTMRPGKTYDINPDIARALIKQKQARKTHNQKARNAKLVVRSEEENE